MFQIDCWRVRQVSLVSVNCKSNDSAGCVKCKIATERNFKSIFTNSVAFISNKLFGWLTNRVAATQLLLFDDLFSDATSGCSLGCFLLDTNLLDWRQRSHSTDETPVPAVPQASDLSQPSKTLKNIEENFQSKIAIRNYKLPSLITSFIKLTKRSSVNSVDSTRS